MVVGSVVVVGYLLMWLVRVLLVFLRGGYVVLIVFDLGFWWVV